MNECDIFIRLLLYIIRVNVTFYPFIIICSMNKRCHFYMFQLCVITSHFTYLQVLLLILLINPHWHNCWHNGVILNVFSMIFGMLTIFNIYSWFIDSVSQILVNNVYMSVFWRKTIIYYSCADLSNNRFSFLFHMIGNITNNIYIFDVVMKTNIATSKSTNINNNILYFSVLGERFKS